MYLVAERWRICPTVFSVIVQRLLLLFLVVSSVVGLTGASRLQDENRLDRFVPSRLDIDAIEQRFHDAFGSDLYLPIRVSGTFAAFIANAFPLTGIVVLQYLTALPLDLGIVLTYSICLGLAVDDTLHLVFDMKKLGGVSAEAITNAEVRCGPGIYESSWILAAGFAFVALSEFLPVRHFGVLATAGVLLALVGDVVILPSIITRFSWRLFPEVRS